MLEYQQQPPGSAQVLRLPSTDQTGLIQEVSKFGFASRGDLFIEIGPKRVLKNMMKDIDPSVMVLHHLQGLDTGCLPDRELSDLCIYFLYFFLT